MSLYIFISDNEMIDAAQIQHLQYSEGVLNLAFSDTHIVTYKGPVAKKVLSLIRTRIDREAALYDLNAALIEGSFENMKRGDSDFEFGDDDKPDWLK